MKAILPPRVKQIRRNEEHLFCPGEGCDARLAIRKFSSPLEYRQSRSEGAGLRMWFEEQPERERRAKVSLETRYTNEPNPRYPDGSWWRKKRGGYKGMERGRDLRDLYIKGTRRDEERTYAHLPPTNRKRWVDAMTSMRLHSYGKYYQDEIDRHTTHRRDRNRIDPPPGTHVIICYECGGKTEIEGSDASALTAVD